MCFLRKITLALVMCGLLLNWQTKSVWADDITITCKKKNCSLSPKYEALFSVKNAMPGERYERNITVYNYQKNNTLFFLSPSAVNIQDTDQSLAETLFFEVLSLDSKKSLLGPVRLKDFKNIKNPVLIGMIPTQAAKNYQLVITFDNEAGNQYQNKATQFNVAFGFEEANTQESFVSVSSGVYPESELSKIIGSLDSTFSGQVAGSSTEWLEPGGVQAIRKNVQVLALFAGLLFALITSLFLWFINHRWSKHHTVG